MGKPQTVDTHVFDPTREVQMWRYNVSHQQLLLRSTKDDGVATRIDVLFKGVKMLQLPTTMTALEIVGTQPIGGDYRRYTVRFAGGEGYVVALVALVAEDEGMYGDPGMFDNSFSNL
jgi:hypothetical protein